MKLYGISAGRPCVKKKVYLSEIYKTNACGDRYRLDIHNYTRQNDPLNVEHWFREF